MKEIMDLKKVEFDCRLMCARDCIDWYINNLSEQKCKMLSKELIKILAHSIIQNDIIFKLYVFQRLRLIDLDFEKKIIVFEDDRINFNVNK